jgi:hypothetical protein
METKIMKNMTIREYLKRYDSGEFSVPDVDKQIDAGWYDWFCDDKSLMNKTKSLTSRLKRIVNSAKVNQDTMYVFFKNNCPLYGSLYDDFRICDITTGDVIYTITPSSGHKDIKGRSSVSGKENDFQYPLAEGTWEDIVRYFNGN